MRTLEDLRDVSIFASLSDDDLAKLAQLLKERRMSKGDVIFNMGDPGDSLFIVESGRIKAYIPDAEGKEKVIALYGQGDLFGEMALLSGQPRSASVAAVTDARVLMLRKDAFEGFLANNIGVMRQILNVFSERQAATNRMLQQDNESAVAIAPGQVITVYSAKGGVGRSTVAINLAIALRQQTGKPVALIDGCLLFGDIGVMLNLEPKKSIVDLLPNINQLEDEILDDVMQGHTSGVKVLLAPPKPEMAELISADHFNIILARLRDLYDYIVIDAPATFQEITLMMLDNSDQILVITTLELSSLKNVKLFLEIADGLGYPPGKLRLVVNRADTSGGIRMGDVESTVNRKFIATLANDPRAALIANNRGVPILMIAQDSPIANDIMKLARKVAEGIPKVKDEPEEGGETVAEEETPSESRHGKLSLKPVIERGKSQVVAAFKGGPALPTINDVIYGLGVSMSVAVVLLFFNALLLIAVQSLDVAYPGAVLANLALWVAVLAGVFVTVRNRPSIRSGLITGAAIGAAYGAIVDMSTVNIIALGGFPFGSVIFGLIMAIPLNAILGLLSGLVADLPREPALVSYPVGGLAAAEETR